MAKLVIEKLELAEADLELIGLSLEKISELKIANLDIPEVLAIDKQQNVYGNIKRVLSMVSWLEPTYYIRTIVVFSSKFQKMLFHTLFFLKFLVYLHFLQLIHL